METNKEVSRRKTGAANAVPKRFARDLVASIVKKISPCTAEHSYFVAKGLEGAHGYTYLGSEKIGGVECHGSVAHVIRNADGQATNVVFMVPNNEGVFEDVLIPGAELAGCYGRIGTPKKTILIAETYEEGMSLHLTTGHCVAVVLHAANFDSVCAGLKKRHPDKTFIICGDAYDVVSGRSNNASVVAAAMKIGALVANPVGANTFYGQYRIHGIDGVSRSIDAAAEPSEMLTADSSGSGSGIPAEPRQWANPVNGAALMADMMAHIRRFVILQRNEVLTVNLWVIFTHVIDVVRVAPILALTSPVRRCGKTTVLGVLERLAFRPLSSSNLTPAVLFRSIDAWKPTLVIDEADTFLSKSPEMIGMLNSGHTRDTAYVHRIGQGNLPQRFGTFCPKAIGAIGKLSETLMDRSIVVRHQRKRSGELVEKYRRSPSDELVALRARIARWSQDNRDAIASAQFELPDLSSDRSLDNWEPLLAIAHCLGQEWFDRATKAAIDLSVGQESEKCSGEELLRDIKAALESIKMDKIPTSLLIGELCSDAEKQWGSFNQGRPLSPRQMANLLKDFGIKSKDLRFGVKVIKGYELEQFKDAFARYVPVVPVIAATAQQPE